MYGVYKPLTKESVLEYVSEWSIFQRYIARLVKPNCSFVSELRDENNASCRVSLLDGRYKYKDFGEPGLLDCFDYVQKKYGLSYLQALEKIVDDFNLSHVIGKTTEYHNGGPIRFGRASNTKKKPTVLNIVERNWQIFDKMYWSDQYGITQNYLNRAQIKPITEFTILNDKFPTGFTSSTAIHAYSIDYYMNGVFRRKIYQPYAYRKWLSNVDNTVVQGIKLLPEQGGDVLFITSSIKDAGTIACNAGIHAIAPNNENSFLPAKVFQKLREKWPMIVLWFDNDYTKSDNPGLRYSQMIAEQHRIPFVLTPDGTAKDPSDFYFKFGPHHFRELVARLLRQKGIEYAVSNHRHLR